MFATSVELDKERKVIKGVKAQKRFLLELIEADKSKSLVKRRRLSDERWELFTEELNLMGGVKKNSSQWQTTYYDLMNSIKKNGLKSLDDINLGEDSMLNMCQESDIDIQQLEEGGKCCMEFIRQFSMEILNTQKTENDCLIKLCKGYSAFCKRIPIWQKMRHTTIIKLNKLLCAEDNPMTFSKDENMTMAEWLLFDTVLVHQDIDVISRNKITMVDLPILWDLFTLVNKFNVENLSGNELAAAWSALTLTYNKKNRLCTPMLLQRRWYQMKLATKLSFARKTSMECQYEDHSPTKLQVAIGVRYPSIFTDSFVDWDRLIKQNRVILRDRFEQIARNLLEKTPGRTERDLKEVENKKQNENSNSKEKTLYVPSVYTTRLDDMNLLPQNFSGTINNKQILDQIYNKSKPIMIQKKTKSTSSKYIYEKVAISSALFQKPYHRSYTTKKLLDNPDFNIALIGLRPAFFRLPTNRSLLKSCKPITVDVSKEFEKRLVNGIMYLKDDNRNDNSGTGSCDEISIPSSKLKSDKREMVDGKLLINKCYQAESAVSHISTLQAFEASTKRKNNTSTSNCNLINKDAASTYKNAPKHTSTVLKPIYIIPMTHNLVLISNVPKLTERFPNNQQASVDIEDLLETHTLAQGPLLLEPNTDDLITYLPNSSANLKSNDLVSFKVENHSLCLTPGIKRQTNGVYGRQVTVTNENSSKGKNHQANTKPSKEKSDSEDKSLFSFNLKDIIEKTNDSNIFDTAPASSTRYSNKLLKMTPGLYFERLYNNRDDTLRIDDNELLLTTVKIPLNFIEFLEFRRRLWRDLKMPHSLQIDIEPNGRVSLYSCPGVIITDILSSELRNRVHAFYEEIRTTTAPHKNNGENINLQKETAETEIMNKHIYKENNTNYNNINSSKNERVSTVNIRHDVEETSKPPLDANIIYTIMLSKLGRYASNSLSPVSRRSVLYYAYYRKGFFFKFNLDTGLFKPIELSLNKDAFVQQDYGTAPRSTDESVETYANSEPNLGCFEYLPNSVLFNESNSVGTMSTMNLLEDLVRHNSVHNSVKQPPPIKVENTIEDEDNMPAVNLADSLFEVKEEQISEELFLDESYIY